MTPNADTVGQSDDFAQSFDARDWAEAFQARFEVKHREDGEIMDEGLMMGWFANAIMRGWDEHARRYGSSSTAMKPWAEWSKSERKNLLDWVVKTCLLYGSQESTAYLVAAEFAKGLGS